MEVHNEFHHDYSLFHTGSEKPGMDQNCEVDPTAKFGRNVKLGKNVRILPYAVIGNNVETGDGTTICSFVSIYDNVRRGNNCMFDSGSMIGGDGCMCEILERERYNQIQLLIHPEWWSDQHANLERRFNGIFAGRLCELDQYLQDNNREYKFVKSPVNWNPEKNE